MKETMTVHKGLSELKILDARIEKELGEAKFVVANKHNNQKINGKSIASFVDAANEKYQSIRTLINRRNAIKRAITNSNAVATVTVGGTTYTVAEAIDMKSTGISYYKNLLAVIDNQYRGAVKLAEKENNSNLEAKADTYLTTMYSGSELKNMSDEIIKVRDAFIASQTIDIVDAIESVNTITSLRNTIDGFMSEVDSALSVSNALTTIDVEYTTY